MTVLERVAAAIAANPSDPARAAVEALREPGEVALAAGANAIDDAVDTTFDTTFDTYSTYVHTSGSDYALPGWRAMLDAILKGA